MAALAAPAPRLLGEPEAPRPRRPRLPARSRAARCVLGGAAAGDDALRGAGRAGGGGGGR